MLQKHLQLSKVDIFLLQEIPKKYEKYIIRDLQNLQKWIPIEYIIQKAEFFSLDFFVDNRVLIPRNDTEILVEQVLKIPNLETYFLVDIGTGSGAIPISILKNSNISQALAIDISSQALEVAKKNRKKYDLETRLSLYQSDLLHHTEIQKIIGKHKKIIFTANLPYIKNGDFENMSQETLENEPHLALFGGQNTGFELYESLIFQIFELIENYKIQEIILFIEIGFDQKEVSTIFLQQHQLTHTFFQDNNQIDRCVKIIFDFQKKYDRIEREAKKYKI